MAEACDVSSTASHRVLMLGRGCCCIVAAGGEVMRKWLRRVSGEHASLSGSLPLAWTSSIFVAADPSRLDLLRCHCLLWLPFTGLMPFVAALRLLCCPLLTCCPLLACCPLQLCFADTIALCSSPSAGLLPCSSLIALQTSRRLSWLGTPNQAIACRCLRYTTS